MKVVEKKFNKGNEGNGIPKFEHFLEAFKLFMGEDKTKFKVESMGHSIHFNMEDGRVLNVDTQIGVETFIKDITDRRSYTDILLSTEYLNWVDMCDEGFNKVEFLSTMLSEWEMYWNNQSEYKGKENDKSRSYRKLQLFNQMFDEGNTVMIAETIDNDILYVLSILSMISVYNSQSCYDEYSSFELLGGGNNEYEAFQVKTDDGETFFYVRECE